MEYSKESLHHFGYIFSPGDKDELKNLSGKKIELCLPKSSIHWNTYVPLKIIKFIRIETPEGTGTGDRSGGRGKILYYTEGEDTTEKTIIYGIDPEWLKEYNKSNTTYYGTDNIYVKVVEDSMGGKSRKHRRSMKKTKKNRRRTNRRK